MYANPSLHEFYYVTPQTRVQKVRRRSLNVPLLHSLMSRIGGQQNLLPTMTLEQEEVTKFRFDYIYGNIVGQKPVASE